MLNTLSPKAAEIHGLPPPGFQHLVSEVTSVMPDRIGRFEILSEIAHSDSSCVYKAADPESGQTVALKVLKPGLSSEQAAQLEQRVLEEAEATKVLSSHNIATLYGAGEIDGQFCAAMEYIQGKSIAGMLAQEEGFSIWDLLDIVRQACQGLDHAHARKVLHYTLEPAKVLVTWDGTVKLLGFGISSMGAFAAQAKGNVPDSLRYMSPEQVQGGPLDARSNLFSLGAILYEMVTSRKAFAGADADQVRQEISVGMPVAPAQINPKISTLLSELIMKALSKAPEQRFQSGEELVAALEICKGSSQKAAPRKMPQVAARESDPGDAESETVNQARLDRLRSLAAAAVAGASPMSGSSPLPAATMSVAAAPPETEAEPVAKPRDARSNGSRRASFSEIDSLPPLKEAYVPPPSPPPAAKPEPEPVVQEQPAPEVRNTMFRGPAEGEKKTPPAELAKKAVAEIAKTPPRLFLYSVGAAALVIILVLGVILSRIHSENADETAPPPQPVAAQSQPAPVAVVPQTTQLPPEAAPQESAAASRDLISVKPKRWRPRAPKVAAPAPVIVPGELTVNSTPEGAQVLVDGHHNPTWVTPFDLGGLAPGQHLVSISKPGYATQNRNLEVASGSKSFLVIQLAALGATALISSVPPGAQVFIDGRATGRVTPAEIQVEKAGNHIFTLRKDGYLEQSTTASLQPGQSFQYGPVLRALGVTDDIKIGGGHFKRLFGGGDTAGMGTVSVHTSPKGAQVAVNHRVLDKNSPLDFYLNPGTYIIDITLSGYKDAHRVINVEKSGKVSIDEILEPE